MNIHVELQLKGEEKTTETLPSNKTCLLLVNDLFQIQNMKSSSGTTESQVSELQEQIEEMSVWKDKVVMFSVQPFVGLLTVFPEIIFNGLVVSMHHAWLEYGWLWFRSLTKDLKFGSHCFSTKLTVCYGIE